MDVASTFSMHLSISAAVSVEIFHELKCQFIFYELLASTKMSLGLPPLDYFSCFLLFCGISNTVSKVSNIVSSCQMSHRNIENGIKLSNGVPKYRTSYQMVENLIEVSNVMSKYHISCRDIEYYI